MGEIQSVRYLTTALLMAIFFWFWPIRLFTSKNNCYFWTLENIITHGGYVRWYRSLTWFGFHCTWVAPDGVEWEYTMPRMGRKPWWYIPLIYSGKVKRKNVPQNRS